MTNGRPATLEEAWADLKAEILKVIGPPLERIARWLAAHLP